MASITHSKNKSYLAQEYYRLPLFDLIFRAHQVHRENHDTVDIERCTLVSIKTGGCSEDCGYCSQSAHYETATQRQSLLTVEEVREAAQAAKSAGAQRLCMGAAWRGVKDGPDFQRVLEMIKVVKQENLESCVTLGMLNASQAQKLKEAGLDYYNHNIDTSREYYEKIISTRKFEDRLETLRVIRDSGISVCSGGIIGMGESFEDRCAMLAELASLDPPPTSVPINVLVPIPGTPLADVSPLDPLDLVRTIAVARILMPLSRIRLSAGRANLSQESQVLAFFAGANSIFLGEKLLTAPNATPDHDEQMLKKLGAIPSQSS
jgi:biotin synthase